MSSLPPVKLSILRDIGWREWDPIGLSTLEGGWEGSSAADEYDQYLLHLAAPLQKGELDGPMIDYLVGIETEHMGASPGPDTRSRAVATVTAVREYVRGLT
jgi:hypothetical protein